MQFRIYLIQVAIDANNRVKIWHLWVCLITPPLGCIYKDRRHVSLLHTLECNKWNYKRGNWKNSVTLIAKEVKNVTWGYLMSLLLCNHHFHFLLLFYLFISFFPFTTVLTEDYLHHLKKEMRYQGERNCLLPLIIVICIYTHNKHRCISMYIKEKDERLKMHQVQ